MDFQRYYDGVGLIVENKINNSFFHLSALRRDESGLGDCVRP